jgi:tetratricopeptide (TPR) repeat protein
MIFKLWRDNKMVFVRYSRFALLLCAFSCILILTIAALPATIELPKAKEKWICQEGELFTLYSSATAKQAGEISLGLAQYHAVLSAHNQGHILPSPVPTIIFVFKDDRGLAPYQSFPSEQPSGNGYFLQREDIQYIAVSAKEEVTRTIFHEYAHAILATKWPGAPLWLQEGLAEYYSTFRSESKIVYIGEPLKEHARTLRTSTWIPFAELMKMDADASTYRDADKSPLFYAQSWILTHFLLHGLRNSGTEAVARFVEQIGAGEPAEKAFQLAFQMPVSELDQTVKAYSEKETLACTQLTSQQVAVDTGLRFHSVPYEEVLFRLGDLLAHQGQNHLGPADVYFAKAIQTNNRYALASAGLGYTAMVREEEATALSHFRQALEFDPGSAWIQYQYGRCLLAAGRKQEEPHKKETIALARDALLHAIALDNHFIDANAQLGEAYMHLGMQPQGQTALEKALEGMPSRMDVARNLLQYYVLADDAGKQSALLKLIRQRGGAKEAEAAQESIVRTQIDRVARLINEKEYSQALALAERLRKQTDDPAIKKLIEEARQAAAQGQLVEIYNQAVRYAADKRYDQAEKLFLRVVREGGKSGLAGLAKTNVSKICVARQAAWYNQAFDLMRSNDLAKAVPLLKKVINDGSDPQTTQAAENALSQIEALQP